MPSRGRIVATLLVLVFALASLLPAFGSDAPPAEPTEARPLRQVSAAPDAGALRLACHGGDGSVPAFETSFLGSCWGHVGHHTYFVGEPRALLSASGSVSAVEASLAGIHGPRALYVQTSMDGVSWDLLGTIPYPASSDSVRHTLGFRIDAPQPTPFRFLRVHMPYSDQEGLAGFLDHSELRLVTRPTTARTAADAGTAPVQVLRCQAHVMEDFYASHPCWFGGYGPVDQRRHAMATGLHLASPPSGSYYGSPSFLHTYPLGETYPASDVRALARALPWRPPQHIDACEPRADPGQGPIPRPVVVLQASAEGAEWVNVTRALATMGEPVLLEGELPAGMRFVRLGVREDASQLEPAACHHPLAFLVESAVGVRPRAPTASAA